MFLKELFPLLNALPSFSLSSNPHPNPAVTVQLASGIETNLPSFLAGTVTPRVYAGREQTRGPQGL